jgi:hypothetical protein
MLFDGDGPGRAAAAKSFLVSRNAPVDLAACFLPDGADPDDFARGCGADTPQALRELPRAELIDVFVESLFIKNGCTAGEKPGANLLGKMADEVAKAIAPVTSEVSRSALITRAARRLGIDNQQLATLVAASANNSGASSGGGSHGGFPHTHGGSGGQGSSTSGQYSAKFGGSSSQGRYTEGKPQHGAPQGASEGAAEGDDIVIRPADQLPPIDVEILRAVMVLREALIPRILQDPGLCEVLQPDTLRFVSELSEVLSQSSPDSPAQREAVKELLSTYGPSWVSVWKGAYDRKKSGISMELVFDGSVQRIADSRIAASIAEQHRIIQTLPDSESEERLRRAEQVRQLSVSRQRGR